MNACEINTLVDTLKINISLMIDASDSFFDRIVKIYGPDYCEHCGFEVCDKKEENVLSINKEIDYVKKIEAFLIENVNRLKDEANIISSYFTENRVGKSETWRVKLLFCLDEAFRVKHRLTDIYSHIPEYKIDVALKDEAKVLHEHWTACMLNVECIIERCQTLLLLKESDITITNESFVTESNYVNARPVKKNDREISKSNPIVRIPMQDEKYENTAYRPNKDPKRSVNGLKYERVNSFREGKSSVSSSGPIVQTVGRARGTLRNKILKIDDSESHANTTSKRTMSSLGHNKRKSRPPLQIDSVRFSAVAPNKIAAGKYMKINILMYEDKFRYVVDSLLGLYKQNYKEAQSGYHFVEHNALIKVVLDSNDAEIDEKIIKQVWGGKYLNFEFVAKIPKDFSEEQILISAKIYINDVIVTKLKLILDCKAKVKHNIIIKRFDFKSAFVSYASKDRGRVASIIQGIKTVRPDMKIFFDVESIQRGQKWKEVLEYEIAHCDILFLFWSKNARESEWVDKEWRYALKIKGDECIEPVPLDSPEECPPPFELQHKHFNDKLLYIIKSTIPKELI